MNATSPQRYLAPIFLFATTLFFSAGLMFIVQPMFGKQLLPLLGGSPSVWNTCMVFYQMLLFFGYLYADYLSTHFQQRRQIPIHLAVILLSCIALPLALPENATPPTENNPTWWLLSTLFMAVGMPFFVVSTTSPLLQKWFAQLGHHSSDDPYYLYAASNIGSLLALLSYPFLIEPSIGLAAQKNFWSIGYVILCLLISGCAIFLWRSQTELTQENIAAESTTPLSPFIQLRWFVLAFVPSSLLLGLTQFISTDIASVPLLWIVPLSLFLLSFVLVFSKFADKLHPLMLSLQPIILLPFLAYSFVNPALLPYWLDLTLHSLAFFLAIMVCHGELAKSRPATQYLTRFYLIMSFAGMLGGMFNTFIAPFIFNAVYEYPLMIVAALLLRPGLLDLTGFKNLSGLLLPLVLVIAGSIIYFNVEDLSIYLDHIGVLLLVLVGLTYAYRQQAHTFALLTGVILLFTFGLHSLMSNTLFQERSFFGVFSVRETVIADENNQPEKIHELFHGTTKHGAQRLSDTFKNEPYMYYSRPGPMGQLFQEFSGQNQQWTIGAVGLGAGALACYATPQQHWIFYEIDPQVIKIAQNTAYFNYLSDCAKNMTLKVGDARLSLAAEPPQKFDLLMLDAFSSDAVPTHLLTQEALQLYFQRLKPNGLLAFHITNRHLALKKVLAIHAQELHLSALIQEFSPQKEQPLIVATDWVVLAKNPQSLAILEKSQLGHWEKLPLYFNTHSWTDDFTNIIEVWK